MRVMRMVKLGHWWATSGGALCYYPQLLPRARPESGKRASAFPVIYRKLSLGNQSEEGERIIERLLSRLRSPAASSTALLFPTSATCSP